jgi:hypothetical protein
MAFLRIAIPLGDGLLVEVRFTPKAPKPSSAAYFGPYTTCYNRFVRWRRAGVWAPCLYRARNRIERFFDRVNQCRRIATRYDKFAANDLALVQFASIRLWLRIARHCNGTTPATTAYEALLRNGLPRGANDRSRLSMAFFAASKAGSSSAIVRARSYRSRRVPMLIAATAWPGGPRSGTAIPQMPSPTPAST